jgi:hypothetical protein
MNDVQISPPSLVTKTPLVVGMPLRPWFDATATQSAGLEHDIKVAIALTNGVDAFDQVAPESLL